ncbi:MAG: hypothetical protein QM652_07510 [Legionella sp.]|uniref:hypothetical protein n=1 Tax=Legionella sp. TaxID=459 RepID=UPI0039E4BFBD
MSGNTMSNVMRTAVFALSLFASAASCAHGGGGWHGGGGGWHGGGGGWHGGGYYHGGLHGGGWGVWGPGIIIGAPLYDDYYYAPAYPPACQTVRVCNNYGHCWLQQSCY